MLSFDLHLDVARNADGRWVAEVSELPGVRASGATEAEARRVAIARALRLLADDVEQGSLPLPFEISVGA